MAKVTRQVIKSSANGLNNLFLLDNLDLKIGWFEGNAYENGNTVATVAAKHEYGLGVPQRSFIRPTMAAYHARWRWMWEHGAKAILNEAETPESFLTKLGEDARGGIQDGIRAVKSPPLAPSTIAARKDKMADTATTGLLTKPLIDTSQMISTVTYKIEAN